MPTAGFARVLVLVEALSGLATTALLIAYLPSLCRAYSQRENRLLRLDDLYFELRGWEEWYVDVFDSHTGYPVLTLFRSRQPEQAWVTEEPLPFAAVDLGELQLLMARTYGERDAQRGLPATVAWLAEEVGELAQAVRKGTREQQTVELGDVLAWLASLANQLGIELDEAAARYAGGCPKCGGNPCAC